MTLRSESWMEKPVLTVSLSAERVGLMLSRLREGPEDRTKKHGEVILKS